MQTQPSDFFASVTSKHKLYICLSAIFVACLMLGDIIGGKTISTPLGPISVGIIPFPITFLLTDVVNEYYGRRGALFLTWLGFAVAALSFFLLKFTTALPADPSTYFTQAEFAKIFGGSAQIFVASIIAYLLGQFLDIYVFQFWKALTESKHLWLRATGSTVLSQIVDTLTINFLFWLWVAAADPTSPIGMMSFSDRISWIQAKCLREYGIKLVVAIALTPLLYALHQSIEKLLKIEPEVIEKKSA